MIECYEGTLIEHDVIQRDLAGLRGNSIAFKIVILQKNVDGECTISDCTCT